MSGRLQDKTALIITSGGGGGGGGGGGTGIGAAAARRFALFPACNDSSFGAGQAPACNPLACNGGLCRYSEGDKP